MEKNLVRFEPNKLIELINSVPDLTSVEKSELVNRILSDDVEIRKAGFGMLNQSQIAIHDLISIQSEITSLNKKGMYIKAKQTIKTGSGHVEIEMKGGDTKLIIPVMIIIGIVLIAIVLIVFLK